MIESEGLAELANMYLHLRDFRVAAGMPATPRGWHRVLATTREGHETEVGFIRQEESGHWSWSVSFREYDPPSSEHGCLQQMEDAVRVHGLGLLRQSESQNHT